MYFDNFPSMLYPFKINGKVENKLIKDITQNVRLRKQILANVTLYDEYDIIDGETPEIVAYKIYGSPEKHWIILSLNDIVNPQIDWPIEQNSLKKLIDIKYQASEYANSSTTGAGTTWEIGRAHV